MNRPLTIAFALAWVASMYALSFLDEVIEARPRRAWGRS